MNKISQIMATAMQKTVSQLSSDYMIVSMSFRKRNCPSSALDLEGGRERADKLGISERELKTRFCLYPLQTKFWTPWTTFKGNAMKHLPPLMAPSARPDGDEEETSSRERGTRPPQNLRRLLPSGQILNYTAAMDALKSEAMGIIRALDDALPKLMREREEALGALFSRQFYPCASHFHVDHGRSMEDCLGFAWGFEPLPSGASLPGLIPAELRNRFEAEASYQLQKGIYDAIRDQILFPMEQLSEALARKLKAATGKERLSPSLFTNVATALKTVVAADPFGSTALADLATEINATLLARPETVWDDPIAMKRRQIMAEELITKSNKLFAA